MNASPAARARDALIFNWGPPHRRKRALILLLFLSALLHAIGFYVFQIVYPPTAALLPPPARVAIITTETEEGRGLLRWIEAEDPALATTTQRPADAKSFVLPALRHIPSYLTVQPALKEFPPRERKIGVPSSAPPGPVRFARGRAATSASSSPTTIAFEAGDGSQVEPLATAAMHFISSAAEPPQAAQFRVAISPAGDVRYCLVQHSSGEAALDEQVRAYLAQCRFARRAATTSDAPAEFLWSIATISWGSDLTPQKTAAAETAAP